VGELEVANGAADFIPGSIQVHFSLEKWADYYFVTHIA
jgi:hypothetical protein